MQAVKFEENAIVMVKKTAPKKKSPDFTGAVDLAVSPIVKAGEEYPVFYHRIFFSLAPEEEYRFVVPFASSELGIVFQTERSTLIINVKPE